MTLDHHIIHGFRAVVWDLKDVSASTDTSPRGNLSFLQTSIQFTKETEQKLRRRKGFLAAVIYLLSVGQHGD